MFSTHGQRRKLCKKFFASCQRIQFDESKCWIYSTGSTKIPFFSLIQNSHCFHIYMYIILYTPRAFLRRRGAHMPRQVATEIQNGYLGKMLQTISIIQCISNSTIDYSSSFLFYVLLLYFFNSFRFLCMCVSVILLPGFSGFFFSSLVWFGKHLKVFYCLCAECLLC